MKKSLSVLTVLLHMFIVSACAQEDPVKGAPTEESNVKEVLPMKNHTPPPPNKLSRAPANGQWYVGTLQFFNLEGGFYGFIGDNGERFLPLNLDKKHLQNGARLKILGKVDRDIMTIQQWGQPFRVEQVIIIKAGSKPIENSKHI